MQFHTPREIKRAKMARHLINTLGSPSVHDLKLAMATNAIANLPITTKDVGIAEKIFGPDIGTQKGKTTRSKAPRVKHDYIEIPKEIKEKHEMG